MVNQRNRQPELMDQPQVDVREHQQALSALGRINWLSGTSGAVWSVLSRAAQPGRPFRVLDIACGGGDVGRRIARRALRAGVRVQMTGCDISETAVRFAESELERHPDLASVVGYQQCDVVHDLLPSGYDVAICTLFLHHLSDDDAVRLLTNMRQAARAVLVDDLRRTALGYGMAWIASRLLTRSPIVHSDGPVSVQGAYTVEEARGLFLAAGMSPSVVRHHWPQRFLMYWSPDA